MPLLLGLSEEFNIVKLLSLHSLLAVFFCKFLRNDNNASFTLSRLSLQGSKALLSNCFKSGSRNTVTNTLFLIFFAALKSHFFLVCLMCYSFRMPYIPQSSLPLYTFQVSFGYICL